MPFVSGLKKIFMKKDRFMPPNEFRLTHKEKECMIILFSLLGCITIVSAVLLIIYR